VAPAASNDDSTPALTCVRMEFGVTSPDVVSFAATDRYRCAAADVLWQPDAMDTPPASLPAAVLERLVRAVPADEKVTIAVGRAGGDAQLVAFHYPGRQLTTRTLSAQFPAVWRQLVNPQLAATAVTGAADMAAALHRAQIVLDTRGAAVTLEFTAAGAALSADAGDAAAVTDHVDASLDGENWAVQVNPAYLADAVKACNTDKVRIGYERPGKAVLITPISHDGTPVTTYGHIVMPLGKGK
jgi:DNA polymerase-3 subunit beta